MKEIHSAAKANATHSHAQSDITGLTVALNGKAASTHSHAQSDVSGLTTALNAKAPLASPAFTGTPTAPTAAAGANTTQVATTAFVTTAVSSKQATVTGGASSITGTNLTASRALISNSNGKVAVSAVTSTELGHLDGVTSNVQTQLNAKAATSDVTSHTGNTTVHITAAERTSWNGKQAAISGAASTITSSNLTASRALVSNSSGKVAVSAVTATELSYLGGAKSNVQTQLDSIFPKYGSLVPILTNNGDSYTTAKNGYLYVFAKANHKATFSIGSITGFIVDGCNTQGITSMYPVAAGVKITRVSGTSTDSQNLAFAMIYS